jgi:alkylation response protein AidB-like acyl-CoA dehydrogenase
MDFSDTKEQAAFRAEVSDWLDRVLVDFPAMEDQSEREAQSRTWQARMHADGWLGIAWPKEYGGRGMSPLFEAIFRQECIRRNSPIPVNLLGILLVGPTIIVHGSEQQKKHYLPRILSAEDTWCQGYSEPATGSDLAGLKTRADEVEDGWQINGQKVWTSSGHLATKCMILARTDPSASKHKGISCFLADTEKFDIRPLCMINGDADFNEMFIDDVFVAKDDLLGGLHNGWNVAMTTLGVERTSVAFNLQVWARQALDRLVTLVCEKGLQNDSYMQDRLGAFEAEVEAIRIGTIRSTSAVAAGKRPGQEDSTIKLQWAHAVQDISRFALELGGDQFLLAGADGSDFWLHRYLRARGHSIEGGTDEIQKSIIAERVLGLPRSR